MGKRKVSCEAIKKIELFRKRGLSVPEISKVVGVSKTTVFRYVRNVDISPEFKAVLLGKRGGSRKRRLLKEKNAFQEGKRLVSRLSYKEKLLILCALYWAEGSKKDFGLSNTDPDLIRLFVSLVREVLGISDNCLRISIRLYEDLDRNKSLSFWSGVVGIPGEEFVNVNILQGKKRGKLEYGMCRVRVTRGGDILKQIVGINKAVASLFQESENTDFSRG